jgi:hypothetical protein
MAILGCSCQNARAVLHAPEDRHEPVLELQFRVVI